MSDSIVVDNKRFRLTGRRAPAPGSLINPCVVIPCFNHAATVAAVARAAASLCHVIVVDDGSPRPVTGLAECTLVRWDQNRGKAAALRAGFARAAQLGFSHVITLDADGQHDPADLPKLLAATRAQPEAVVVGVRGFQKSGCPALRRYCNALSTLCFRAATGLRLGDSQCGFRCYPLALVDQVETFSDRFAFELEFLVRAAWMEAEIVPVPVNCSYKPEQVRQSNFRGVRDFALIALMLGRLLTGARPGQKHPAFCEASCKMR